MRKLIKQIKHNTCVFMKNCLKIKNFYIKFILTVIAITLVFIAIELSDMNVNVSGHVVSHDPFDHFLGLDNLW